MSNPALKTKAARKQKQAEEQIKVAFRILP